MSQVAKAISFGSKTEKVALNIPFFAEFKTILAADQYCSIPIFDGASSAVIPITHVFLFATGFISNL